MLLMTQHFDLPTPSLTLTQGLMQPFALVFCTLWLGLKFFHALVRRPY